VAAVSSCGTVKVPAPTSAAAAATWHLAPSQPVASGELRVVSFPDASHGWAEGGGIDDLFGTNDGGLGWQKVPVHLPGAQQPGFGLGLVFTDDHNGWLAGLALAHTSDGGATWSSQGPTNIRSSDGYWGLCFADANHGWVVGQGTSQKTGTTIDFTTDGGRTWQASASLLHDDIAAIAFANDQRGWAVGGVAGGFKPCILATSDGGRTWVSVYHGPGDLLLAVAFADQQHGWAVGWGIALRTTDGGATWSAIKAFDHTLLFTAAALDSQHVWVAGQGGIWASSDGGVSWQHVWRGNRIYSLTFSDPAHGWAVGSTAPGGGAINNVPGLVLAYGPN
jgi:hypothetical protein